MSKWRACSNATVSVTLLMSLACTSQQPVSSAPDAAVADAPEAPPASSAETEVSDAPPAPVVRPGRQLSFEGETFLLDDFEDAALDHALGGSWNTSFDSHGLGTTLSPSPLAVTSGGALNSQYALGIEGHFGRNVQPWPYADLRAAFAATDLSQFSKLRFWARGNGKEYVLAIVRETVTDFAHYRAEFVAPVEWTLVELPLSSFHQPEWGVAVEADWRDATAFSFQPSARLNDEAYELVIDQIELVRK